jgi:hypothetical protein
MQIAAITQRLRRHLRLVLTTLTAVISVSATPVHAASDIDARGAFSCDFQISGNTPPDQIPPAIERDRMYMAARPGMLRKDIPLSFDSASSNVFSGGRYLFKQYDQAQDYKLWVQSKFILDGVLFLQRPYFINPECHAWKTVGARDFGDMNTQHVVTRTERFRGSSANVPHVLQSRWPQLASLASAHGLSSVYLWYSPEEHMVSVVSFAGRVGPKTTDSPDFASLGALAAGPGVGQQVFGDQGWLMGLDRTQWVFTIWLPFVLGDQGLPSVWPNSPVFSQPYSGDGVCEVSRGENSQNSGGDCLPTCWNGVQNAGENSVNCPGDVRLFPGEGDE